MCEGLINDSDLALVIDAERIKDLFYKWPRGTCYEFSSQNVVCYDLFFK